MRSVRGDMTDSCIDDPRCATSWPTHAISDELSERGGHRRMPSSDGHIASCTRSGRAQRRAAHVSPLDVRRSPLSEPSLTPSSRRSCASRRTRPSPRSRGTRRELAASKARPEEHERGDPRGIVSSRSSRSGASRSMGAAERTLRGWRRLRLLRHANAGDLCKPPHERSHVREPVPASGRTAA